jgi:hypothetical protein
MLCPKCKTENDDSANFCSNCQANLKEEAPKAAETPVTEAAPKATETPVAAPTAPKTDKVNFFKVMLDVCLKPMTAFKEHLPKFAEVKNAGIIAAIIVVAMTLLSTITTVVGTVREKSCTRDYSSSSKSEKKCETKWDWENLEDADLPKHIGETFLMNVVTIVLISGAYFGMSKAFKSKTANYFRMLTVVALGFIPSAVLGFLAPILGGINLTFGGIVGLSGTVYSACIIIAGLNSESGVEGDKKVYLNIASIACIVLGYYILVRFKYGELGGKAFEMLLQSGTGTFDLSGLTGGSSSYGLDSLLDF